MSATARVLNHILVLAFAMESTASYGRVSHPPQRTPCPETWKFGRPAPPLPLKVRESFPDLRFNQPVYIKKVPDSQDVAVVELAGTVFLLSKDGIKRPFCKIQNHEVYSIEFHPGFKENRNIFLFANGPSDSSKRYNRIFRASLNKDWSSACDPLSLSKVIEWDSNGHNGGDLAFDRDGLLYISAGDGSSDSDAFETGQDISDLRSSILRIDVDHPTDQRNYEIPKDNPFLTLNGARPEIWAYGVRNPWRMTFNPLNGDLLVGDNGQDTWESIQNIHKGENYGWSVYEGSHPFRLTRRRGPTPISQPLKEHPHHEARSIVGGIIYRGSRFPNLTGMYIYGDFVTGRIWGMRYENNQVIQHLTLAETSIQVIGFGEDFEHEPYIVDFGGRIYALTQNMASTETPIAEKLSNTGLFTNTSLNETHKCLIPYDVNAPLWSDGAEKERYIALPGNSRAGFDTQNPWDFPESTTFIKTFWSTPSKTGGMTRRRIETRILTLQKGQWNGYSYKWNDQNTDAILVGESGEDDNLSNHTPDRWRYPSRAECGTCHSRASGFVLGLKTAQLNRKFKYPNWGEREQLEVLKELDVVNMDLSSGVESYDRLADPYDPSFDLNSRARAYLDSQCAMCHVLAGGGNSSMNLTYKAKLGDTRIIDVAPEHTLFGIQNARIVAPGEPERSVLFHRVFIRGEGQMPPLGSKVTDTGAVDLLRDWINGLVK